LQWAGTVLYCTACTVLNCILPSSRRHAVFVIIIIIIIVIMIMIMIMMIIIIIIRLEQHYTSRNGQSVDCSIAALPPDSHLQATAITLLGPPGRPQALPAVQPMYSAAYDSTAACMPVLLQLLLVLSLFRGLCC
jgi:hypothetical protein